MKYFRNLHNDCIISAVWAVDKYLVYQHLQDRWVLTYAKKEFETSLWEELTEEEAFLEML